MMKQLFDTTSLLIKNSKKDFYFRLEQLVPWSDSEMIQDNISIDEVHTISQVYDFSKQKVDKLIAAKKYNKKYNPSCDTGWVRLTKVFTS